MNWCKIIFSIFFYLQLAAQENIYHMYFNCTINNKSIERGKVYYSKLLKDSIQIETLKFYISDLVLLQDSQIIKKVEKKYFLVDLENKESQHIIINLKPSLNFNRIQFNIGVDSIASVSGAMGGVLDPINGMYWAWQSGYINFKLEGTCKGCNTRNNRFQFHIGGYQLPYKAIRSIDLRHANHKPIIVQFAIDELLEEVNLKENCEIMSPNLKAMNFANLFSHHLKISK